MADCLVPAVDPDDDSVERHVVRHYAYDPERRERRHQVVGTFSGAKEADALMQKLSDEGRAGAVLGEVADPRDYLSVVVWEPGYHRLQSNARLLRAALGHGVSVEPVQDLGLPGNVALLREREGLPLLRRLGDRLRRQRPGR